MAMEMRVSNVWGNMFLVMAIRTRNSVEARNTTISIHPATKCAKSPLTLPLSQGVSPSVSLRRIPPTYGQDQGGIPISSGDECWGTVRPW